MDRPIAVDDLPSEPWRNGRGITRTVAVETAGAQWRWRISLADLSGDAPFSRFPGVDRQAALVRGTRLVLTVEGTPHELGPLGRQVAFAGESEVHASSPTAVVRLWNVMVRRGAARAHLQWLRAATELPQAGVRVLLAIDAACVVRAGSSVLTLAPGHCWMPPAGPLHVAPAPGGGLLFTHIAG